MSSENPRRRRPSPAVYRRRRAVVLVGLLVVVALVVWLLVAQPWRGSADSSTPPASQSSSSPSASPTDPVLPDPAATGGGNPADALPEDGTTTDAAATLTPEACTAESVLVEALTDKESYASGEIPQLSIRLTNTSATPCTINVGTTQQTFTITSGNDTWWRSTDCQAAPSDMVVTLAAGQVVESSAPIAWDRTRSSVGTCEGERPRAPGGGASYHVDVSIGGVPSVTSRQILLY
jgi:cytoskeletal protein RodZ